MKKKIFSLALSLVLVLAILPTAAFAAGDTGKVITVNSTESWKAFCEGGAENADATVNITADFFAKGYQFTEEFTGTLNGNGYTVTMGSHNATETTDADYHSDDYESGKAQPLFVSFAGTARNLVFGSKEKTENRIAVSGTTYSYNCHTSAGVLTHKITGDATLEGITNNVFMLTSLANTSIGGLVGEITGNDITVSVINCKNTNDVDGIYVNQSSTTVFAGGFVGSVLGENVTLSFIGCENSGWLHSNNGAGGAVGGFVGKWSSPNGKLSFNRCVNSTVQLGSSAKLIKASASGFVGKGPEASEANTLDIEFVQCANRADIVCATVISASNKQFNAYVSGFVSNTNARSISFEGCSNTGDMTISSITDDSKIVLNRDYFIEVSGFAASCNAAAISFNNCYGMGTQSIPEAMEQDITKGDYTLKTSKGAFTGSFSVTVAKEACIDLNDGTSTLADAAKLAYGTLYNADGSFVWETSELTVAYGARVRTVLPTGIRFDTTISKADYKALTDKYESVSFGTVIVPLAYLEAAGEFTFDALEALPYQVKYLNVEWTADALLECDDDGDMLTFNGSVVNIAEKNYELQYAARGYARCTDAQGNVTVIYASYDNSFFNRSVYDIAEMALADADNGLSTEALAVIQKIYDKVNGN